MRVLVCTNSYPPRFVGGAELVAHKIAREMARLGHEVAVFAGDLDGPGDHHTVTTDMLDGVRIYRVATRSADYAPVTPNYVNTDIDARFSAILHEFCPTVVHAHNLIGLSVRMLMTARESGARVFVTLHDFWGFCLRNTLVLGNGMPCIDRSACADCLGNPQGADLSLRVRRDMMALAFDHVEGFLAPSRYLADQYIASGFPRSRMQVVPNGIDVAPFVEAERSRPVPDDDVVVLLYAGYFGAHKGLQVLLRALSLMRTRQTVRLDLVGDGPVDGKLRAMVQYLGLAGQVRFRGKIQPPAMPQVYAACDVLVLASIWPENQPVCLMEAMACARPVVATRIGGVPDMIEDGREGVLVKPNDPRALADALDRLVAAPELRKRMGQLGRIRVQNYGYAEQAAALGDIFARVDAQLGPAAPAKPIVALLGDDIWRGYQPDTKVTRALATEAGYAIPFAWLTKLQRQSVSVFLFVRANNRGEALGRRMFGPKFDLSHIPRALAWLGKAFLLRRKTDEA